MADVILVGHISVYEQRQRNPFYARDIYYVYRMEITTVML